MNTRFKRYHFHKSTFSTLTFDMLFSESRADPPIEQVLATCGYLDLTLIN